MKSSLTKKECFNYSKREALATSRWLVWKAKTPLSLKLNHMAILDIVIVQDAQIQAWWNLHLKTIGHLKESVKTTYILEDDWWFTCWKCFEKENFCCQDLFLLYICGRTYLELIYVVSNDNIFLKVYKRSWFSLTRVSKRYFQWISMEVQEYYPFNLSLSLII